MAMVADSFPEEHLHIDYSQNLWQKQASEHLGFASIKHSLNKYKNTVLSYVFLYKDRGVNKAGADVSL